VGVVDHQAGVGAATRLGQQCSDATAVTGAGDFSGDGKPDVVCRGLDSVLYLNRSNGSGGFYGGPVPFGWGFDGATKLMWPGDFSGDGKPDLIARNSVTSNLVMYRGDGEGGWVSGAGEEVGRTWPVTVFTVGDFSGDGKPDFFLRDDLDNGKLYLYRGNGAAGWIDRILADSGDWRGRDHDRADVPRQHGPGRARDRPLGAQHFLYL
jgi:hypothetical protein